MKVTTLLADHVQVADGKLFVAGGGWNNTKAGRLSCGVGAIFSVPLADAGKRIVCVWRLLTDQGELVTQHLPTGEEPMEARVEFEVGRPAHARAGDSLNVPLAINASAKLSAGVYFWQLEVNGEALEEWQLRFRVAGEVPEPDGGGIESADD